MACEWFVNAVEWLGVRLRVGPVAVGTVLAAAGTALPESVVTLVAVLSGTTQGEEVGVGAALGGPLVVGTVAYGVTGVMLLLRRRSRARITVPTGTSAGAPRWRPGRTPTGSAPSTRSGWPATRSGSS